MDSDLARRVVELATRAPSVYNTQPWRFVAGEDWLDLYADRSRQLTTLDPTGRQLVLSCGAVLGFARTAVRALGHGCRVELLPDDADLDHLARLAVTAPRPAPTEEIALARAIGRRRTVRDRFDSRPLPAEARARLDEDAAAEDAWLRWVDSVADRTALAVLADRADRIEHADRAVQAELARWRREEPSAVDGIPTAALPALPTALRGSDIPLRDFDPVQGDRDPADPQHLPLPAERPDLVVLGTRYDGPTSWLHAGQATARVLLRATTMDLVASPLTQVLDIPWTRQRLRTELRLGGHPQLVLRLGYGRIDGPRSPRRGVEEVLSRAS
ncbi:MAG: Acg family FMN-binding oxidoreductase [Mycobacteriales bacterium]